jgi:predicted N-acetyltransferase YhbS
MSDAPSGAGARGRGDAAAARVAPGDVVIRRATRDEADAVAAVVRSAFQSVADSIGIDIPPLHESAADVLVTFDAGDVTLVAVLPESGELVGTVRGETMEHDSVMVRRLGVTPGHRGAGIARALMLALEHAYPDALRFELFTGAMAAGPIALYESLGYAMMQPREAGDVPLVWLEKCR